MNLETHVSDQPWNSIEGAYCAKNSLFRVFFSRFVDIPPDIYPSSDASQDVKTHEPNVHIQYACLQPCKFPFSVRLERDNFPVSHSGP